MNQLIKKFQMGFLACSMLGICSGFLAAQNLPPEVIHYADIVLYNGKIITADEGFSIRQAVAIRDGKFLAVGDSQAIEAMAGPQTRKVDLEGRSVIPGLIATHQHGYVGNSSKSSDLRLQFKDVASGLEEIKAYVANFAPGEEVWMGGPSNHSMTIDVTLAQLDAASPNNPIVVTCPNNQVVVNSLMLKRLLPEAQGMFGILKDEQGNPTGQLRGGPAGIVLYEFMPWHDDFEAAVAREREQLKRWGQRGITTVMGRGQGQTVTILRELWKEGLPVRIRLAHEMLRSQPRPEAYLKRVGNLTDFGDEWLKIIGVTVQVIDGSTGPGAGLFTFPKINQAEDDAYGPYGWNKWAATGDIATSDRRNILLANRYGWSVMGLHSNGDISNDILLEAFSEANQERPLAGRHFGFDHQKGLEERHFDLIKEMGMTPSMDASAFSGNNESLIHMYGPDAVYGMSPVKSAIDSGIRPSIEIGGGMESLQAFITRKSDDGRVWNPEERVSRQEALYMYTLWAARYSGEQDILGSIEVGKLGDLVVLGADYMTWPEDELSALPVLLTVVGGKVVYEASGAF
ncbi:MAG: amidohydrolase family protein [Acidobacteria bacterium]|nr:amidohydrolase family protein [Acidobacteriota bacterium]